jgi:hypothetical protein
LSEDNESVLLRPKLQFIGKISENIGNTSAAFWQHVGKKKERALNAPPIISRKNNRMK